MKDIAVAVCALGFAVLLVYAPNATEGDKFFFFVVSAVCVFYLLGKGDD